MKIKVGVSIKDMGSGVKGTIKYLLNHQGFRTEVHQIYAETVDPWVPYLTGALSSSGLHNVDANGVHYTVDYADTVYHSSWAHYPLVHPLASSYWDQVAMQTQRDTFIAKVQDTLSSYAKRR